MITILQSPPSSSSLLNHFESHCFKKSADRQPCHKTLHLFSEIIRGNIWCSHCWREILQMEWLWCSCSDRLSEDTFEGLHTGNFRRPKYVPTVNISQHLEKVTFRVHLLIHKVAGLHASRLHNSFSDPGHERSNIYVIVEDVFLSKLVGTKAGDYWNHHLPTLIGSSSTDETN